MDNNQNNGTNNPNNGTNNPNNGFQQGGSQEQPSSYSNQAGGSQEQSNGFSNQADGFQAQPGYSNQAGGAQEQPSGYNNQGSSYGNQPGGYGNQPSGYNNQNGGYNNQASGYNNQPGGYNSQNGGYNNQAGGYNNQNGGYNNQPGGYNNQNGGYYNQPGGGYPPYGNNPYPGGPTPPRILTESCYNIRRIARESLKGMWTKGAMAAFLMTALITIPATLIDELFGFTTYPFRGEVSLFTPDVYVQVRDIAIKSSPLSGLYYLLVAGALLFGVSWFFLHVFRKKETSLGDVFIGFEKFGRSTGLFLFMVLFLFLWLLVPIAGIVLMIIAGIRYCLLFPVAIDHPELSVAESMNESKRLMRGNKAKLFSLWLSLIGWWILAMALYATVSTIVMMLTDNIIILMVFQLAAEIALYYVEAYWYTCKMVFYDMLTGRIYGESYIPGLY